MTDSTDSTETTEEPQKGIARQVVQNTAATPPDIAKAAKTPRYAWVILLVTYLASLSAPLGQFKVTLMSSVLADVTGTGAGYFVGMDAPSFGLLMSSLAIIGAILAFPGAFICRRLGLKWTSIIAVACVILGGLIGVFAGPTAVWQLYIGRFVEGIGIGLIGVSAPTIISLWFPDKTRGLALGFWCTWVPMAIVIDFNLTPFILSSTAASSPNHVPDWHPMFWFVIVFAAVALVLFALLFRLPKGAHADYAIEGNFKDCFKYLKNKYIWILGLTFMVFNFCQGGVVNTYYNAFLEGGMQFGVDSGWGATPQISGFMTMFVALIGIVANPVFGGMTGRLKLRWRFLAVTAFALLYIICFNPWVGFFQQPGASVLAGTAADPMPQPQLWVFIILMGLAAAVGGGGSRPLAPSILSSSAMAATMGMAVMQFTQCVGTVMAPIFGLALNSTHSWGTAALYVLMPLSIVALLLSFFIRADKSKDRGVDVH
ncbi:MAG: MFS transporter [Coriobacteriales bacterium]|jgi:MFS family permease|nr:MFS transporter [Coriobacteriales bacterium]